MSARIAPLAIAGLLVMGGIDAWLVTALLDIGTSDDEIVTGAIGPAPTLQAPTHAVPPAKPIDAYGRIVAQPVFFKTRTPFVAPLPPPAPPPPPAPVAPPPVVIDPGLVLGGIMMKRDVRKIYLFAKADPQGTWAGEGETFKGWKVQSVGSTSTKLQQKNRTIELHLHPPH